MCNNLYYYHLNRVSYLVNGGTLINSATIQSTCELLLK